MDKVKKYRDFVKNILSEIVAYYNQGKSVVTHYLIEDDKNGHYLLFSDAWKGNTSRYYGCSVHVEVKDNGKVYLHYDMTEEQIGQQLLDLGVKKKELVPTFQPPDVREEIGFAAA